MEAKILLYLPQNARPGNSISDCFEILIRILQ